MLCKLNEHKLSLFLMFYLRQKNSSPLNGWVLPRPPSWVLWRWPQARGKRWLPQKRTGAFCPRRAEVGWRKPQPAEPDRPAQCVETGPWPRPDGCELTVLEIGLGVLSPGQLKKRTLRVGGWVKRVAGEGSGDGEEGAPDPCI